MRYFFFFLQFETRLHFKDQPDLTAEDLGHGTRYFPLVGLVVGGISLLAGKILLHTLGWTPFTTAVLALLPLAVTGGLHADGFMDTMDGVLSCRDRERMLAIMKDSRVGSYGVLAFVGWLLLYWSMLLSMPPGLALTVACIAPVIGRLGMVRALASYPYARKTGMGQVFAQMADWRTVRYATITTVLISIFWGWAGLLALLGGLLMASEMARHLAEKLDGLTGDTYGCIELMSEAAVLLVIMLYASWSGQTAQGILL